MYALLSQIDDVIKRLKRADASASLMAGGAEAHEGSASSHTPLIGGC
jgi:hypothetical protein